MSKERAGLDLDLPDFQPRPKPPAVDRAEVREAAERSGFTARHAPVPSAPVSAPSQTQTFDARSLRRSTKTAKLNIAVTEEVRQRFWTLAQNIGTSDGQEALVAMMNAIEAELNGSR
ncbi:hypothetical protein [Rhizobium rhizoryzae]|uniref:Stability/partitioning determinant n=1 Tax=Rhizobium rhizoryzae TaxID=451876 RepID=A0A7W6PTA3_9HYPH|nr:hypothetical protein [Rhizobium rhizoryzae]MBB4145844.1 hypothetical protein [Rhizobium rhizoryzae]